MTTILDTPPAHAHASPTHSTRPLATSLVAAIGSGLLLALTFAPNQPTRRSAPAARAPKHESHWR